MIFFDLEAKKEPGPDDIWEGADHWDALRAGFGGLSVAVTITDKGEVGLWDEHDLEAMVALIESDSQLVTYNGTNFDLPLLSALVGRAVAPRSHLDLYEYIAKSLPRREAGYCLDAVCQRTLGIGKSGEGAQVDDLVAKGRWGALFRYCLQDVFLLRALYQHLRREGWIITVGGRKHPVPLTCDIIGSSHVEEEASSSHSEPRGE